MRKLNKDAAKELVVKTEDLLNDLLKRNELLTTRQIFKKITSEEGEKIQIQILITRDVNEFI